MTLKILVVEGCSETILRDFESRNAPFSSETYKASLLLNAPKAEISVAYPYAPNRNKEVIDLERFDGFALTGSSVPWGAEDPEAKPYLQFVAKLIDSGKPVLGSCWGMQTVAVLLGGVSGVNPNGSEIGIARNITLTEAGKSHPLFAGMPDCFDSPAMHRDHVIQMPEGAVLLASNAVSEVQAMAYQTNGVDYMGFQFHPEIPLELFAAEYHKRAELPKTVRNIVDFPDIVPAEIADPYLRTKPLANWLAHVGDRKAQLVAAE